MYSLYIGNIIMTIRKNFIFDEEVSQHLKDIADRENTTQTQVTKDLIEEKLEALYAFAGSGTGLYGDLTIQEIKANMDV